MATQQVDRYPATRSSEETDDEEAMQKDVVRRSVKRWRAAARRPDGPWHARLRGWRTWTVFVAILLGLAFSLFEARRFELNTDVERVRLWGFVDPGIALATVITTVAVWWSERGEHWLASIEKRLTFVAVDAQSGKVVLHCDLAPLVHEGDVRALAISLSAQMSRNRRQEFRPDYIAEPPRVVRVCDDDAMHKWIREYRITVRLEFAQMEGFGPVKSWIEASGGRKRPYVVWADPKFEDPDGEMPPKAEKADASRGAPGAPSGDSAASAQPKA